MPTAETDLPWDQLLRHGSFVRSLARSLVRDAATADDVAQSTWLAIARQPPTGVVSLRGWLREVVGNVARQRHRSETRLAARERTAARDEAALPGVDVEAAQLEVQQRLLAAVQKLDAKYRSVVVLRFYEGLPPRKIAARLGLPVATVRTQLQRAIEQLRDALDADGEGGREQWLRAMAPLAVATGGPAISLLIASAAAVVLSAGATWWAVSGGGAEEAASAESAAHGEVEGAQDAGGSGAGAPAVATERAEGEGEVASVRPDVSGRVVDAFGRPIEGAAIELDDRDEATPPRHATSAVDGRFAFDGVEFGNVTLAVRRDGSVGWRRWLSLDRSHSSELGLDVVLLEGRTVRGVVVDDAGAPIAGARLAADSDSLRGDHEWPEGASGSDGRFVLDGVPTCGTWLTVAAPGFAWRRAGPFDAAAGDCTIALVAEASPRVELVALDLEGAPLDGATVSVQPEWRDGLSSLHFRMPRALQLLELPDDGRLVTDALPSGRYRFRVYSRVRGCRGANVSVSIEPGATTRVELRANETIAARRDEAPSEVVAALTASLRGTVVDDGGAPVAGATIELERPGAVADDPAVATATSDFDGRFEFAGLAPSSTPLRLRVGYGRPPATKVMEREVTLDAGAVIEGQQLVVPRCAVASGRVVDGDGQPLHGAIVRVHDPSGRLCTTTGRDGTFRFDGLAPGEVRLSIVGWMRPHGINVGRAPTRLDSLLLSLAAGEVRSGLELVDGSAPDEQTLHGTIVAEGGLTKSDGAQTFLSIAYGKELNATISIDDTRFRIDGVADAGATLAASWLQCPEEGRDAPIRMVFGPRMQAAPGREPVEVVLPAPVRDLRVHARLVAAGGGAPTSPLDLVVALVDLTDTAVAQVYVRFARTDGELVIEGLGPGHYELRIGEGIVRRFEVVGTTPVELGDIELAATERIEGIVVDAAGAPVAGARIGSMNFSNDLGDGLDRKQEIVTTAADGAFSIAPSELGMLLIVADGFAPFQLPNHPTGRRDEPIVLLAAGDLVLTGFPRDLAGSDAWRTALLALDPPESRVGYSPELGRMGAVERSITFARLPVGLYALCFWKVEPGVHRSNEPKPTQTVPHEAYRWTVEVKEGLTTTIDLSKEW